MGNLKTDIVVMSDFCGCLGVNILRNDIDILGVKKYLGKWTRRRRALVQTLSHKLGP